MVWFMSTSIMQTIKEILRTARISPVIAGSLLDEQKGRSDSKGISQPQAAQYFYTDEEKKRFRDDPDYLLAYRKKIESSVNDLFDIFIAGSDSSKSAQELMTQEMIRRIGPGNEELKEKLIPSWAPGCEFELTRREVNLLTSFRPTANAR
jgi:hypothetical protein